MLSASETGWKQDESIPRRAAMAEGCLGRFQHRKTIMNIWNCSTFGVLAAWTGAIVFGLAGPAEAQAQSGNEAADGSDSVVKRVDPTDFSSRVEVRNEHRDLQDGGSINLLAPRLDYAVSNAFSLRLEIPIVSAEPNAPDNNGEAGLGDLLVRTSYRASRGGGYAMVMAADFSFDTASKDSLGTGKNVIAPLVFASLDMARYDSVFFPFLQHYITVSGDHARPDVSYTSIKTVWLTRWPEHYYTVVEPHIIIDHERADRVGLTLEGELGRFLNRNLGVWARPGIGLHGDNMPQVYNWNIEVGFRYIFN